MARLDSLPPDQRAVLQLVLRQGRAYDDLADVLKIPGEAVRQRALLAAETLVPPPDDVTVEDGEEVVDYLLGQPGADVSRVSPAGRRWGRDLSRELDPIAPGGLPDLPEATRARKRGARGAPAAIAARLARRDEVDDGGPADVDAPPPMGADEPAEGGEDEATARSSRLGGALLLLGLGIFIAALLILLINRGGDDNPTSSSSGSTTSTSASSAGSNSSANASAGNLNGFKVRTQVNLAPTAGNRGALAIAQLVTKAKQAGFAVTAQGLTEQPNTYLAVWVTGGPKPIILAAVTNDQIAQGRFTGLTRVPKQLKSYDRMLITRERITKSQKPPSTPSSDVIVSGDLKVPADFTQ